MKYILLLLVLTGCSSFPKVPEKVLVPVSVSCVKELPTRPQFLTHDYLKSLSNPDFVTQITAEYLEKDKYINQLEALLLACRG